MMKEYINHIVARGPGDEIYLQKEVQLETLKEGTVFKKAKSQVVPRLLILTRHRLILFDPNVKALKEKKVRILNRDVLF